MAILPFGEYRPDVSDYEGQTTKQITNVVPQGDGYGPFMAFASFTAAMGAACRGIFYALKNDGSISIFAGTSTKLYNLNNTTGNWTDVSKGSSTYSALSAGDNWCFAQFNNFVFAVQGNAAVQVFDLTSSTLFDDLAGSPPQAKYVSVVNRFLVLSGITSGSPANVYRIQWSGLNATTTWTSGVSQSDFQDLADGGIVRGVAGGEFGVIFQDRAIRRMTFAPGSPIVFGIERISSDDGLFAPYSIVSAGDRIFFCSIQGFKMLTPGGYPTPIGKEKVDRTFFADVDTSNLQLVLGASDPRKTRVYWAYKSLSGSPGLFDKILCYDWALDRWSTINQVGEYLGLMAQPGITLEGVDAAYGQVGTYTTLTSISSASPAVFTLSGHGLTAGRGILLNGTLPTGLSAGTPYYVKTTSLTASTFTVSLAAYVGAYESTGVPTTSSVGATAGFQAISIDSLTIPSLDGISNASIPQLGAVDSNNKLGFFSGSALEATLISSEHGNGQKRIHVNGFRPVTDASSCYGSLQYREREQDSVSSTAEVAINTQGMIPQRQSARYARGKLRIPAGVSWTYASGVEPDVSGEGER